MKPWKTCHYPQVKRTPKGMKVTIYIMEPMAEYVRTAADDMSEGCVCQFVGALFADRFKQLSEELLESKKAAEAEEKKDETQTPAP